MHHLIHANDLRAIYETAGRPPLTDFYYWGCWYDRSLAEIVEILGVTL